MRISVREARLSDADELADLTIQLGYAVDVPAVQRRLTGLLQRTDQRFIVADVEGHVAGWLHAAISESVEADPYVAIVGLVVDRGHRRHGIGRRLLAKAEKWAREQRCTVVRLRSSAARTAAHRFYEHVGYTNIKTQYAFAKSVDGDERDFEAFVPRVDRETA
jgi:GNAT superfamily N-acetyltransferase